MFEIYLGLINAIDIMNDHDLIPLNTDYWRNLRNTATDRYLSFVHPSWQFIKPNDIVILNDGQVGRVDCPDVSWEPVTQGPIENRIDPTPVMF